jgi:aminoglycoside 3'-phosphotransferase II
MRMARTPSSRITRAVHSRGSLNMPDAALQTDTSIFQALPRVRGYDLERVSVGRSASSTYQLAYPGKPTLFLKVIAVENAPELKMESDCLNWLATRTSVPGVLKFGIEAELAYLLTEALPGCNAVGASPDLWSSTAAQVASQLRRLHSLDAAECPFDRTLDRVLPLAATRAASGLVDESDFDPERLGCNATELLDALYRERPGFEDIVVTHGDFCLPNMIFDNGRFSGFVDCGRCGRADRYQDLALAHRSIEGTFGKSVAGNFLEAYGLERVDTKKLSYYRLLDEFF